MRAAAPKGIVCNTGILGSKWTLENFEPLEDIPSTIKLTVYNSETITAANSSKALEHILDVVVKGQYKVNMDKVFRFEEIVEANQYMEENRAKGKVVVTME
jgi:NADPH2:quinone reductase